MANDSISLRGVTRLDTSISGVDTALLLNKNQSLGVASDGGIDVGFRQVLDQQVKRPPAEPRSSSREEPPTVKEKPRRASGNNVPHHEDAQRNDSRPKSPAKTSSSAKPDVHLKPRPAKEKHRKTEDTSEEGNEKGQAVTSDAAQVSVVAAPTAETSAKKVTLPGDKAASTAGVVTDVKQEEAFDTGAAGVAVTVATAITPTMNDTVPPDAVLAEEFTIEPSVGLSMAASMGAVASAEQASAAATAVEVHQAINTALTQASDGMAEISLSSAADQAASPVVQPLAATPLTADAAGQPIGLTAAPLLEESEAAIGLPETVLMADVNAADVETVGVDTTELVLPAPTSGGALPSNPLIEKTQGGKLTEPQAITSVEAVSFPDEVLESPDAVSVSTMTEMTEEVAFTMPEKIAAVTVADVDTDVVEEAPEEGESMVDFYLKDSEPSTPNLPVMQNDEDAVDSVSDAADPVTSDANWEVFDFNADDASPLAPDVKAGLPKAPVAVAQQDEQMNLLRNELRSIERLVEAGISTGGKVARNTTQDEKSAEIKPATLARALDSLSTSIRSNETRVNNAITATPVVMGRSAFAEQMAEKVVMMMTQKVQVAEIRLDPKELGAVDVKIRVQHDQTSVVFSSPHAQVRDALETSIPRLREMFAEAGVGLGSVNVNDRSASGGGGDAQQGSQRGSQGGTGEGDGVADDAIARVAKKPAGIVDYYA